jgi:hypothetical protein
MGRCITNTHAINKWCTVFKLCYCYMKIIIAFASDKCTCIIVFCIACHDLLGDSSICYNLSSYHQGHEKAITALILDFSSTVTLYHLQSSILPILKFIVTKNTANTIYESYSFCDVVCCWWGAAAALIVVLAFSLIWECAHVRRWGNEPRAVFDNSLSYYHGVFIIFIIYFYVLEGREILIPVVSVSDFCFDSVFGFQFGFHMNHKNQIEEGEILIIWIFILVFPLMTWISIIETQVTRRTTKHTPNHKSCTETQVLHIML